MKFDTKIAIILREDLATWQKLNMTAFLVSGIAACSPESIGDPYEDGSGNSYLPMFVQPVLVFSATAEQIQAVYDHLLSQRMRFSVFTEELFTTGNDVDNRAAVKAVTSEALKVTGLAVRDNKKLVDSVLKGLALHK